MASDFERMEHDVLEDWRAHPVTEAFHKLIMTERAHGVVDLVDTIKTVGGSGYERLQHIGGRLAAIDELLRMMRK